MPDDSPIRVRCSHCGRPLRVKTRAAGTRIRCPAPDCSALIDVPAAAASPHAQQTDPAPPSALPRPGQPTPEAARAVESCVRCGGSSDLARYPYVAARRKHRRSGAVSFSDTRNGQDWVCAGCGRQEYRPVPVYWCFMAGWAAMMGLGFLAAGAFKSRTVGMQSTYTGGGMRVTHTLPVTITPSGPSSAVAIALAVAAVVAVGLVVGGGFFLLLRRRGRGYGSLVALRCRVAGLRAEGYQWFGDGEVKEPDGEGLCYFKDDGRTSSFLIYGDKLKPYPDEALPPVKKGPI